MHHSTQRFIVTDKTPQIWLLPTGIAAFHHFPPPFRHTETTVKGSEMGYHKLLLAKIGHPQLLQPTKTGMARRRCIVPLLKYGSYYYECGNNWQWSSWKSASWFAGK
jgi:hypothetical protein